MEGEGLSHFCTAPPCPGSSRELAARHGTLLGLVSLHPTQGLRV